MREALIPLAVIAVAFLVVKTLRAGPRAFGLPKDAFWTPESNRKSWKDHTSRAPPYWGNRPLTASEITEDFPKPLHVGVDLASGKDYSVETTIDRHGNVVSWKPVHGDPLPEEEESDMERGRRG